MQHSNNDTISDVVAANDDILSLAHYFFSLIENNIKSKIDKGTHNAKAQMKCYCFTALYWNRALWDELLSKRSSRIGSIYPKNLADVSTSPMCIGKRLEIVHHSLIYPCVMKTKEWSFSVLKADIDLIIAIANEFVCKRSTHKCAQ